MTNLENYLGTLRSQEEAHVAKVEEPALPFRGATALAVLDEIDTDRTAISDSELVFNWLAGGALRTLKVDTGELVLEDDGAPGPVEDIALVEGRIALTDEQRADLIADTP